uniref:Serpin domain-containing protein n=1 Tax=Oryza punctata TaxID=4537 RepID=A0A0E0ME61_ORYPU
MEDAGNCGGMTAFALRLAKHLSDGEGGAGVNNKNLVFSPVSLYAALALVAAGAQGTTLHELLALLGAASLDDLAESVRCAVEVGLADESASGGPRVAYACGDFVADHPFAFFVVEEKSDAVLFAGHEAGNCGGMAAFELRLAKRLADDGVNNNKNLVFSPVSLYAALALVAAGAQGTTLHELLALLGAASLDDLAESVRCAVEVGLADESASGGPRVAYACGVWHDETLALKPAYRDAAVEIYKAETRAANFQSQPKRSRKKINKWVSKATNRLIPEILPDGSVHRDTALVLVNAIYFKGNWSNPFPRERTTTGEFHRLDGSSVDVKFMRSREDQYIGFYKGFKVLKLPYHHRNMKNHGDGDIDSDTNTNSTPAILDFFGKNVGLSMYIFLPDARDGLPALVDEMASSSSTGSFLRDHRPRHRIKVGDFRVPRFKVSFYSQISKVLKGMGIEAAFDQGKADLSGMVDGVQGGLVVEKVFHRAVVEVNEEGTEAAASTAVTMVLLSMRYPVDFVADHPFAFFVVEETSGAVLFTGHVLDPTSSE